MVAGDGTWVGIWYLVVGMVSTMVVLVVVVVVVVVAAFTSFVMATVTVPLTAGPWLLSG